MTDIAGYYDKLAATYSQNQYDLNAPDYPAEYFRLQNLIRRLKELGNVRSLYEIGVGTGDVLAAVKDLGINVGGCDVSAEMVRLARQRLPGVGLQQGRIEDLLEPFIWEAVVAFGILPHTDNENRLIASILNLLHPGGRCFVEFRNKLFSLFSMNRYTKEFITRDLLRDVSPTMVAVNAIELDYRLDCDNPPVREFDTLTRFHNPFELAEWFTANGFKDLRFHWYHFHPTPPALEPECNPQWRQQAFELEGKLSNDWRGYFLCSAGVLEAVKA